METILTQRYPDSQTERVQIRFANVQLFEFTAARMISRNAGGVWKLILYFSARDFKTFKKYGNTTRHQTVIRRMAFASKGAASGSAIITSIVSAQDRLYGTTQSGSSWCIRPQSRHISRRIMSTRRLSSPSKITRRRRPRIDSAPPHIGQSHVLIACT